MSAISLPGWPAETPSVDTRLRSLWLRIFAGGFVIIIVLLLFTLFTPIPYGDLSRIGQLSEHEFGWRLPQPPIDVAHLQGAPIDKADILVIGDSYSMENVWQSRLVRAGYGVTTAFWYAFDSRLCGDFDAWIAQAGFHGKLVIIQSVERLLKERMLKTQECANGRNTTPLTWYAKPYYPAVRAVPGFALNWGAKLTSGLITWNHTRQAKQPLQERDAITIDKKVKVRVVPGGCQMHLFSNRLCDRALFFHEDDDNAELTPKVIEQMQAFSRAQNGVQILWVVVPDKTTTYVLPERSKDFVAALRDSDLGPDLFSLIRKERTRITDLYFPNDTHLSIWGQNLLGDALLQAVRERIGPSPGTNH
ncbi:MAG: hypothetical protein LBV61_04610 [Burkholderiaceae bacterium]|jgi:hypothetical protein|nr:hypothetical protein [Burkholderiaceae bacterium]